MSDPDRTDVASIMAKFPGPVRLYADKRVVRFLCGTAAAVLEFVALRGLFKGGDITPAGWVVLVIYLSAVTALLVCTAFMMLNWNSLALNLDRDGFTIDFMFRPRQYACNGVGDFAAWKSRLFKLTTYNDRRSGLGVLRRLRYRWRRRSYGRDTALLDTYGLGAEGLAQLISQWQQRALGS